MVENYEELPSSFYLTEAAARVFGFDESIAVALKYQLDSYFYYYGRHYKNPREKPHDVTAVGQKFEETLANFLAAAELLCSDSEWEHAVHAPRQGKQIIVSNAYFSWKERLESLGFTVEAPLWNSANSQCQAEVLLSAMCGWIQELYGLSFQSAVDRRFHAALQFINAALFRFYNHSSYKALFVPFTVPPFECLANWIFRDLGKKRFLAVHGLQGHQGWWEHGEHPVDYYVVWGRHTAEQFIAQGMPAEKVIVTGHPDFPTYQISSPRFSLERILVLTRVVSGAPSNNFPVYQNIADSLDYLFRIQAVLRRLGVQKAWIRPHPAESSAWYAEHTDPSFYAIDDGSLAQTLERSTLVIGCISTVFIEALLHGVNYVIFEPTADYNPCRFYNFEPMSPYNGADPRVPVAKSDSALAEIISASRRIDIACVGDLIQKNFDATPIKRILSAA